MSVLLFQLRNVPDDEANEIRELLKQHAVEFYETGAGNWGISMPGLWVSDDESLDRGRALIGEYQRNRQQSVRAQYQQRQASGQEPGLMDKIRGQPVFAILILAFCLFILYVSIKPIMQMIQFEA